ncbi:hypothetical protein RND71_040178 [Anisodus tanguticus]|uniref:PPM-type phosphatase domain-containing protein n=1 Tax=Anisodus tanguticus TaxID=243964 RepID=A0AAE1USN2_9SOLA|nr:hypothetical protein RND71_040178 [Anisodus tanguticus]
MGFKEFQLKIAKKLRLRNFIAKQEGNKKRGSGNGKRLSWMMPITHGYYVSEERPSSGGGGGARPQTPQSNKLECDEVVVQREQVEEQEWWFYGVFDTRIGGGSQMRRKSKETLKKAHVHAKAKIRETEKLENTWKMGSASAIVINGEKLILADMVVRRIASDSGKGAGADKPSKSSELVVGSEKIDRDTEFVILASPGIWEVMKQQEAVNLIRHLEDPQEAAECLAKEAITRMSKNNVSCLIIRFE